MPTKKPEIDLSKIKNLDAINKMEPGFEEKTLRPAEAKAKGSSTSRFNFTEAELIPLPSGGRLYENITTDPEVLKGFIRMRQMTIKEEELLSTSRFAKTGSTTRMIISRCVESEIDAKDILLFDSNFLLFYLRKISYGDEYSFELQCANALCEKKFEHKINISELKFETLPENFVEPIEVLLPRSKYTIKVILPRLYHSEEIYMRNMNRKKKTSDEDRRLVDNIFVTTLDILDPEGKKLDRSEYEEFLNSLVAMDRATLTKATDYSTGVDKLDNVECPYCGTDYSGTIPIGIDFFRF
jgi:hypothetical protein